jgi:hypothetical protein
LAQYLAQPVGNDQRTRLGVEVLGSFENPDSLSRLTEQVCSEQARNRSPDNPDFAVQSLISGRQSHPACRSAAHQAAARLR